MVLLSQPCYPANPETVRFKGKITEMRPGSFHLIEGKVLPFSLQGES